MGLDGRAGDGRNASRLQRSVARTNWTNSHLTYRIVWEPGPGDDVRERVEAVKRWYIHDWQKLDNKIKSSIVEGVSVFLSIFDMPDVARVFCPPAPPNRGVGERRETENGAKASENSPQAAAQAQAGEVNGRPEADPVPPVEQARPELRRHLPPLYELIESGKVLALNMPAGANPALARAIGVMLKNAWLQALLRRPAKMKESPGSYFRPAVFICDEYQAFASVGEDDPSGDEKSLCPHAAVPLYSDHCHTIYLFAALGSGQFGGVADASANAAYPDFPVSQ